MKNLIEKSLGISTMKYSKSGNFQITMEQANTLIDLGLFSFPSESTKKAYETYADHQHSAHLKNFGKELKLVTVGNNSGHVLFAS